VGLAAECRSEKYAIRPQILHVAHRVVKYNTLLLLLLLWRAQGYRDRATDLPLGAPELFTSAEATAQTSCAHEHSATVCPLRGIRLGPI